MFTIEQLGSPDEQKRNKKPKSPITFLPRVLILDILMFWCRYSIDIWHAHNLKVYSFRKCLLSAYYVHHAREESETKKQIQFLQDAIYVDQRKGRYGGGHGTEERPGIDSESCHGLWEFWLDSGVVGRETLLDGARGKVKLAAAGRADTSCPKKVVVIDVCMLGSQGLAWEGFLQVDGQF